ncbi:hypothetical protein BH20ACT6_BH20ACT6_23180 [soil metagenome]
MTTTNAKTTPKAEMPDLAQKFREQLLSTVQQGQQVSLDAAQTWVKAVSALPTPELPSVPGVPAVPSAEATTKYTFDVAADLLNAQREYALQLAGVLTADKSA